MSRHQDPRAFHAVIRTADEPGAAAGDPPGALTRPRHAARVLTRGGREAEIELDGMIYNLRITRQGKLILTK
ncbi:hemin uptake protein hemP [Oceanicella actignis]|nr:hemin uptake protein hemP [Oceanicella actignis]